MAVKYKEYKAGKYTESDELKGAKEQADYWDGQKLEDFQYEDFAQSDRTNQYQSQLDSLQGPGDFSFSKQQGWDDIINKILNREQFTYDVNGDALYQQYKDQYINQGKMAMMDTMGQAAAMTGGYGNSYAQSVGQQAYQGYLQQLTDKIPELYSLALDKYNSEGEELYNQYSLYSDQFNTEYGQHRDAVADYQTDRNYLADRVDSSLNADLNVYNTNRDTALAMLESRNNNITSNRSYYTEVYNTLRNTEWGQYMDNETLKKLAIDVANDNLYKQEQTRLADAELKLAQDKFDWEKSQYDAGGSGGGDGTGDGGTGGNGGGDDDPEPAPEFKPGAVATYNDGVKYLKEVNPDAIKGLSTMIQFNKEKAMNGGSVTIGGVKVYKYRDYLEAYCNWAAN